MILLTSEIKDVWYKLGIALCVPINLMDKINGKHNENPMKALNRVYRYWLADKKGQIPTWDGLISALNNIKEYTVATTVKEYTNVSFKYVLASILP